MFFGLDALRLATTSDRGVVFAAARFHLKEAKKPK
jgi:hypothetical protein